jgi:dolichol-phosphate mannosyltransferase
MLLAAPFRVTVPFALPGCAGTWIVVPTYNEIDSLPRLLEVLLATLDARPIGDVRVLVVDDDSPDGTGAVADAFGALDPRVRVLHRAGKTGLGDAYVAGFGAALAGGAERIIQMDADGSHDPAAIWDLLEALDVGGADLVLGSRYVPGGSTPDWSLRRRLLSRGGCAYARAVLGLPLRDLTGGFKGWRRGALATVLREPLTLQGYGFQIELTHRAVQAGLGIAEVPICFRDRRAGESKLGAATVREALLGVPGLRRADHPAPAAEFLATAAEPARA